MNMSYANSKKFEQVHAACERAAYHLRCAPASGKDGWQKGGALFRRALHGADPLPGFDPPPGSKVMIFKCTGWNLHERDTQRSSEYFARQLNAGIRYMILPPNCGNIDRLADATIRNYGLIRLMAQLAKEGWFIICEGFSRGGFNATLFCLRALELGAPANRMAVLTFAGPFGGSDQGWMQYQILKALRPLKLERINPFFSQSALEAAAEMIPGSKAASDVSNTLLKLDAAGVYVCCVSFENDGLVRRKDASPPGIKTIHIPYAYGHCSLSIPYVLAGVAELFGREFRELVEALKEEVEEAVEVFETLVEADAELREKLQDEGTESSTEHAA